MATESIPIHQIVALDEEGGIGLGETLPWNLSKDWENFLRITTKTKVLIYYTNNG